GVVVDALDRHRPVGETTRVHVGVVAERGDVVAVGRAGELDAVGVRRQVVAIQFDLADPTVTLAHGTAPFAAISTVNVAARSSVPAIAATSNSTRVTRSESIAVYGRAGPPARSRTCFTDLGPDPAM